MKKKRKDVRKILYCKLHNYWLSPKTIRETKQDRCYKCKHGIKITYK